MAGMNRTAFAVRIRCWLALLVLAVFGAAQAQAPQTALERQVKAAYLYKFAGFVEWPEASFERPDSPLQIGVAGNEQLAEQLERVVAGRNVNGRPITVRRLRRGEAPAGLHILYVDSSMERGAITELLGIARGQSLLTVTDAGDGLALGCMISFVVSADRLRFDVALKNVAPSGLRISARMLAVANRVQGAS